VALHSDTSIGAVRLTVADTARARDFYERVLGLRARELGDGSLALGVDGEPPLVIVTADASAPRRDHRLTGLFHLALLVPSRKELAQALMRVARERASLSGASDHLVSEALYLSDPDGNGIEIYRDRPREEWPHEGGTLQMATLPLDLDDVLSELASAEEHSALTPAGTRMGHVHLQVSELGKTERFYAGVLGFDVVVRGYPGALFMSAGGYHHHIGTNTWHSAGASAPPTGMIGLRSFEVVLPDGDELERVLARVRDAGLQTEPGEAPDGALVRDPSGNGVLLTVRS
jgi:catechol 2,3-dioxygenase